MKKMKRIITMMLALVFALALAVPALAESTGGTITINNAVEGKTYKAYRLFDLSLDKDGGRYGYTVNAEWNEFFTTGKGKDYVTIDQDNGNVTLTDSSAQKLQELAKVAKTYAEGKNVTTYNPTGTVPTLTFNNLPLGYYLVTTDAGALQALDTTNHNAVMYEKNTKPTVKKEANKTNVAYGEDVHFKITVTKGGYVWGDYAITDSMKGLELKPDTIKLTVNGAELIKGQEYSVHTAMNPFTVIIPQTTLNKKVGEDFVYPAGTEFVLEYDAVAKATVSMENRVYLDYTNDPNTNTHERTPEQIVKVANYEFVVKKTDEKQEPLGGATFELHKQEDCKDVAVEFIKTGDTYRLAEAGESAPEGSERTSTITAGKVTIEGLAAGTYYLKEMTAPDGYNKLLKPVKVEIIENRNTTDGSKYHNQAFDDAGNRLNPTIKTNGTEVSATDGGFVLQIVNKTGTVLPSTGGIGTTIFYIIGGLMMIAAVVAFVVKKRMEN